MYNILTNKAKKTCIQLIWDGRFQAFASSVTSPVTLNFSQAGTMVNNDTNAVKRNGNCGPIFSHRYPPIIGAGRDTIPRLVLNKPNATPRKRWGTALLIND
jgi:hypothetical protein